MKRAWRFIVGIGATIVALLYLLYPRSKKPKNKKAKDAPPENTVTAAARENVQQTFEEEVERINDAVTGPTPADSLVDLGNARRRKR